MHSTFEDLTATGQQFLEEFKTRERELDAQLAEISADITAETKTIRNLDAEIASARHRAGRVPEYMDQQRMAVCAATGLRREDVPFIAELLDVRPDQEQWRLALEVSLAGSTRRMLVPAARLAQVRGVVNQMPWHHRMHYEPANLGQPMPAPAAPETAAGKLVVVADSPYAGWVARYIADPARNATCVLDAVGLDGPGYRVTQAGQTRRGNDHAHGRSPNERNIIGSDNVVTLAELERDKAAAEARKARYGERFTPLEAARQALRDTRDAYNALVATPFQDIDVLESAAKIAELEREQAYLKASDATLAALDATREKAKEERDKAKRASWALDEQLKDLEKRWGKLVDRADALVGVIGEHEDVGALDVDVQARLHLWWAKVSTPQSRLRYEDWSDNRAQLRAHLRDELEAAQTNHKAAASSIERVLRAYQSGRFADPNLVATVDGLRDFLAILAEIQATGLPERSEEWRQKLLRWSGQDLVPLQQEMTNSILEIEARLDPVNSILRGLPFGATDDRLKIKLEHVNSSEVTAFRRRLTELTAGATRDLPQEAVATRFAELKEFMALLRADNDPRVDRNVAKRDRLLDVRRQVHITADRLGKDGLPLSVYDHLGGKSGGETQELIAFIIGAALRYRLGDLERNRPRFAPVFLDEAFIKADAEHSGRAVKAWLDLGFQLIVGAPTDKVGALEPHMSTIVSVTKDHSTNRSYLAPMTPGQSLATEAE